MRMMSSVYESIKFTTKTQINFEDEYLITLDTNLQMNKQGRITYKFYQKPIASKLCMMKAAAISDEVKRASLSQDLIRRMMTTDEEQAQGVRDAIVDDFEGRMKRSGYDVEEREEIICKGLIGYQRKVEKSRRNDTPLHRKGCTTIGKRYKKKVMAKTTWYKPRNDGGVYDVVGRMGVHDIGGSS